MPTLIRLNLGAGNDKVPGYLNVDKAKFDGTDIVADLDQFPWPWKDGEVDRIRAFDVFEHVKEPLLFMSECHRVLRPGGILDLHTCSWKSENAFTDPTHQRASTLKTFGYWIEGSFLATRYPSYAGGRFFEYAEAPHYVDGLEIAVLLRKPVQ